jgi:hypothetical protein
MKTLIPPLALGLLLTSPAASQAIIPLVLEGDAVAGVGNVTSIDGMFITDLGEWLVEADTDFATTDADGVVLRGGVLYLREGDPLVAPAGTSVGSFDSVQMNDAGDVRWNLFLDGATTGTDSGFFHGTTLLIQEGDAPAIVGLSAGSAFQGFFEAKTDDAGTSLLLATVDDPAITSTVDQVFLLVSGDDPGSLAITVAAKEGDVLSGQIEAVEDFNTGPHDFAYSATGHVMFFADLAGATTTDGTIYLNGELLAQEGSPSPVAGRNWSSLSSAKMDVNATGHHVYSGSLDGDSASNTILIKDGAKFVQEGDSLPAISPFAFTTFGSGPVWISDFGDVMWYGDWDDPNTDVDTGLFRNDELLIQEGVTQIGGLTVDTVRGVQDGYFLSDDGLFAIVELELTGGIQAAVLIAFQDHGVTEMTNCTSPAATLAWTGGAPVFAGSFDLTLDNPQGAGVLPVLGMSTQPIAGYPPCGLDVPGIGELLIDVFAPNPVLVIAEAPSTGGPTTFTIPVPPLSGLVGADFFVQGLYVDTGGTTSETFRPSGGLRILFGV